MTMGNIPYKVRAKIWLYPGAAGWHFLTLPKNQSQRIKKFYADKQNAWGSIRINATIGKTTWKTSLFPDNKQGAYVLPIKKDVRRKENITYGDMVTVFIEVSE